MRNLRGLGAVAVVLLGMNSASRADLVIDFQSMVAEGSHFRYFYTLRVSNTQSARPGDFVTLYDIDGLIANSVTPDPVGASGGLSGFDVTENLMGSTPTIPLPLSGIVPDSGWILNLTFTKNPDDTLIGPVGPYTFSFLSTFGVVGDIDLYAGQALNNVTSLTAENIGQTQGPTRAAVPEASVTAMMGIVGLMGLGYRKLSRGRKAA